MRGRVPVVIVGAGLAGLAGEVPARTSEQAKFRVRVAAGLRGPVFHEEVSETDTSGVGVLSPSRLGTAGQHELEPLLRRKAEELGAELRFGTELVSLSQDENGVTAVLRDRRDERTSGGNTAVGDAYDLAWKLALVLGGQAGPALLDTYDAERRPIADRVIAEA